MQFGSGIMYEATKVKKPWGYELHWAKTCHPAAGKRRLCCLAGRADHQQQEKGYGSYHRLLLQGILLDTAETMDRLGTAAPVPPL